MALVQHLRRNIALLPVKELRGTKTSTDSAHMCTSNYLSIVVVSIVVSVTVSVAVRLVAVQRVL